jgi:hypothetical protein
MFERFAARQLGTTEAAQRRLECHRLPDDEQEVAGW